MHNVVCLGIDLLEALVSNLKAKGFDYVSLTTGSGIGSEGLPEALFVKAVNSTHPHDICNFAAVESEEDAEKLFFSSKSRRITH